MKRTILILLTALLSSAPLLAQYSPCYEAAFAEGKRLYNAGNYSKAKTYFNEAKDCPDHNATAIDEWIGKCDKMIRKAEEARQKAEQERIEAERKAREEARQKKLATEKKHKYIDLGLPSGTLWATCNIGASKPEDYGDHFAWGETQTKSSYNVESYKYSQGGFKKDNGLVNPRLTKYCNKTDMGNNGFTDNLTELQASDDPAAVNWGNGWHTPTKEQWQELLDNTINLWTTQNDVLGRLFIAKNGKTLFLPAAGACVDSKLNYANSYGCYWSKSLYTGAYPLYAWELYFRSDLCEVAEDGYRCHGISVRPVREK